MEKENTFGNYKFPSWVPMIERELITNFWGSYGRTYKDWQANAMSNAVERCVHVPGNGFKNPKFGDRAIYFVQENETCLFRQIEGKYIHRWNNIGALIDDKGCSHYVSSCDCWVRVLTS